MENNVLNIFLLGALVQFCSFFFFQHVNVTFFHRFSAFLYILFDDRMRERCFSYVGGAQNSIFLLSMPLLLKATMASRGEEKIYFTISTRKTAPIAIIAMLMATLQKEACCK